ncbi:MAG TPA: radical SAM protein [Bacteroidetes bacterium]|nr:radical SAM protein [Bacteroidota bacterium]
MQKVPVMEHFYTLQGEGHWAGTPAYFIRYAGCDVGCIWCDVKESWTVKKKQYLPLEKLVEEVVNSGTQRVVITGGEPTMYDLNPLTNRLKEKGLYTHIETSGTHPFSGDFDWITLSPKKFKPTREIYYELAQELKVIVYNKHDLIWAQEEAAKCDPQKTLFYLQPEWSRREDVHRTIEFIKAHPEWKLSLQTHKYLNIP